MLTLKRYATVKIIKDTVVIGYIIRNVSCCPSSCKVIVNNKRYYLDNFSYSLDEKHDPLDVFHLYYEKLEGKLPKDFIPSVDCHLYLDLVSSFLSD
jgi:hypothetical protein